MDFTNKRKEYQKDYQRKYYQKNKVMVLERKKRWKVKNRDRIKLVEQAYYQKN